MDQFAGEHSRILPRPAYWISTGIPVLDWCLRNGPGGGIPSGRITEAFGEEGSCKSSLLEQLICGVVKTQGGAAHDFDKEKARSERILERMGMTLEDFDYQDTLSMGICALYNRIMEILSASVGAPFPSLIAVDSISAFKPDLELTRKLGDDEGMAWGEVERRTKQILPTIQDMLHPASTALVVVNQLTHRSEGFGQWKKKVEVTTAAKSFRFMSSIRMHFRVISWIKNALGNCIGHVVKIEIPKNREVGPNRKVVLPVFYDTGYDPVAAVYLTLREHNMLKQKNSWWCVQTRFRRHSLQMADDTDKNDRYARWHDLCAKEPELLQECIEMIWDPDAVRIVSADDPIGPRLPLEAAA